MSEHYLPVVLKRGLLFPTRQVFGTYQRSWLVDLDSVLQSPTYASSSVTDLYTPAFYGGFWVSYRPIPDLHLGISGNFWTKTTVVNNYGDYRLPARVVFNVSAAYDFSTQLTGFITIRGLTTNDGREYLGGDIVQPTLLAGVRLRI